MKLVISLFLLFTSVFATQNITICGTGDSQKLLKILASSYEKQYPDISIDVPKSIGSGGGIKNTALDKCDIGRVAREIGKNEKKYDLEYLLFAYSPIVFVVNPSVENITNLTTRDIIDIYSGNIKRWNYLDKTLQGKIYVSRREAGDSSTQVLNNKIKGFRDIKAKAGKIIFNTPDTVKVLVKYKNTIGYLPLSQTINTNLKLLRFNGFEASTQNIQQERYSLVSPFGLVYKQSINKTAKDFIAFIQTKKAQDIINKNGAVSVFKVQKDK